MARIIIPGRPITKKNSQQIFRTPGGKSRIAQSKAYREYEERSLWWLKQYRDKHPGKVHVCAKYWMPSMQSWPDLLGVLQATCDILEKAGIIENDKYVVSLDGSEIVGVDKKNPRVEIFIEEVG